MRGARRSGQSQPNESGAGSSYAPTRRGLIAALAVLSTVAGARTAHAGAILPGWGRRRRKGGGGGSPSCFLKGTRIRTPDGEVAIETLAIGDLVETASGEAKPITWIGQRRYERPAGEGWSPEVLPVKVARSAFGPLCPHADLYLSEAHAVHVDGLLIPVVNLVNGHSIVKCSSFDVDAVEYFHIELAAHDVIFAEGAPAETLCGERAFDNWSADQAALATIPEPFAPVVPKFGPRAALGSRLRVAVSPWVDRRQPTDIVWDRLAERAETLRAA